MKKIVTELFNNIFGWHLLSFAVIIFIYFRLQDANFFIMKYLLLLSMVILSISYFTLSNYYQLDRKNEKNKLALAIRSCVSRCLWVVIFVWIQILLSSFNISVDDQIKEIFILLSAYSLIFSLLAIMMGIKLRTLLILMIVLLPILLLLGVFDIKWWALVTGFITLWNFINSEDFLTYLRVGKSLKDVPRELKYKWSINKLVIYIFTFLFYFSLIISSFFEKQNPRSFEEYLNNGATRVYSMLSLVVLLMVLFGLIFGYYYLLNREQKGGRIAKILLNVGKKIGLDKFNSTIKLYVKAKKGELK
ncbi:Uncharacterised protein [Streptococcus pneumoniae]|uniref:hypothetical protein n=1 Tax=Streptococcus pneumoniae TaxID=1313 RepID=UPI0002310D94|nr:hypothetical protein [Streptococcus pneumoniae]EHD43215.1 putative membrane protein [Streptococcus pneumoniae GA43265]EHD70526.1 putative membrane protein [Streptococcus pneumoniae 6963-05]WDT18664.1 hypothetical protein PVA30_07185 [Streptococcus pneumoniae]WDT21429.1 hypothetical protein PVA35_01130 [Streptococcus pneumoniae]WDT22591.1 hypothetical protein PVA32_07170 [Streptococcus pneumoniae]